MIIDQLPTVSLPVQDTDEIPIERGQETFKASVSNLNKVSKSGDTMTGQLIIANSVDNPIIIRNTDVVVGTAPSGPEFQSVVFADNNGNILGQVRGGYLTDKRGTISLIANNGSGSTNSLSLYVSESGSSTVFLSAPTQWLSQLGLGTSGVLPITIAQGGTGMTEVETTSTVSQIVTVGSGFSIDSANYVQWGKIAMIDIVFKKTAAVTTATLMTPGTIVTGKRPARTAVGGTTDTSGAISNVYMLTSGNFNVYGTWAANATKRLIATYILP